MSNAGTDVKYKVSLSSSIEQSKFHSQDLRSSAAQKNTAIIDWNACLRMYDDDKHFVDKMLKILAEDLTVYKSKLARHFEEMNVSALREELHKLRGGVSYLKLPQLESALKIFHHEVKQNNHGQEALKKSYDALQKAISDYLLIC